jgi:hypothetical protein
MNNQIVLNRSSLALLLATALTAGCGDTGKDSADFSAAYVGSADLRNEKQGGQDVLRIREDLVRNRLWVLTSSDVRVYNTAATGKRLIRTIALPNWSVVGFRNVCMPDLVLDRSGSAFIASNGQARLMRIDADRFALKDYAISFRERDGMDIGFGALAFAADGALFARTTPGGMLWKIDLARSSATMTDVVKKLPADQCAITTQPMTTQLLTDFERS